MQDRQEQRYEIASGEKVLFVAGQRATGWSVWLNRRDDYDGVNVGSGPSRETAIDAAIEMLLEGVRTLRAHQGSSD